MYTTTKLGELIDRFFRKPEPEHVYALVDVDDGKPVDRRFALMTDSEAENTNTLFRQMGMDRRWMRRGL